MTRITWTGDGEQGLVPPGAFQDFGLSVLTPDAEGETLTFKALQTYEGGEVVRWIGAPDAEEPAPTVTLTAAAEAEHAAATEEEPEAALSRRSRSRTTTRARRTGSRSPGSRSAGSG